MEQNKLPIDEKAAELVNEIKNAIANVIEASDFKEPTPNNNNLIVNVLLHVAADYFAFICAINKIKDDAISDSMTQVGLQYERMFRGSLTTYRATPDLDKLSGTQ